MKFSFEFLKEFVDINISARELADKLTLAGLEVVNIEETSQAVSLETEVTTNRYDWLSLAGLAYETAALLDKKVRLKPARIRLPKSVYSGVSVTDRKDCPLYLGALIEGVKIQDSPGWLKKCLLGCGINPVSNAVDITNYCMLKWGQPLHAFDYNKISFGKIFVRRAEHGEKIITLDGRERKLAKEVLVIADSQKPIALAGIMGGKETEISSDTRNIFLEAAIFNPLVVRRGARIAGLSTDSSYRFERYVYPLYTFEAFRQACEMFGILCHGKVASWVKSGIISVPKSKTISFSPRQVVRHLGLNVPAGRIKKILRSLGGKVKSSAGRIVFTPPAFRRDLQAKEDVFEEIARIYGYGKIPVNLPLLSRKSSSPEFRFDNLLRRKLNACGFQEIITYSLVQQTEAKDFSLKEPVFLANALRREEGVLRTSLCLGMVKALNYNLSHKQEGLKFFELGRIFFSQNNRHREVQSLCLGTTSSQALDILRMKAAIHTLLEKTGIEPEFKKIEKPGFVSCAGIICQGQSLGFLAALNSLLKDKYGFSQEVFLCEMEVEKICTLAGPAKYRPVSLLPQVFRDISFALSRQQEFSAIEEMINKTAAGLCRNWQAIDFYSGKKLPAGFLGMTLRLSYQHPSRTLTSEEVDSVHEKVRRALMALPGVILR